MTFEQFQRRLDLVRADIDRATWAHYTTVYINEAAHRSDDILQQLNRDRNFWNYQRDALQCSLFMALGRLFETKDNALTLARLLNESSAHADALFSRSALAERKRRAGLTTEQVAHYMSGVKADPQVVLRKLKNHVKLPKRLYLEKYQNIRHLVFGHAVAHDSLQTESLYGLTDLREAEGILFRVHEAIEGLFDLAFNGMERDLSTAPPTYPAKIRTETYRLLGYSEG